MDRVFDEARVGPVYLRRPVLADMVVEAFHYNADVLGHYVFARFRGHAESCALAYHSPGGTA